MKIDPKLDLVLERVVDVPPEKVWRATGAGNDDGPLTSDSTPQFLRTHGREQRAVRAAGAADQEGSECRATIGARGGPVPAGSHGHARERAGRATRQPPHCGGAPIYLAYPGANPSPPRAHAPLRQPYPSFGSLWAVGVVTRYQFCGHDTSGSLLAT
jgi:hypothetical protein